MAKGFFQLNLEKSFFIFIFAVIKIDDMQFYKEIFVDKQGVPFLCQDETNNVQILNQESLKKASIASYPTFVLLHCREISTVCNSVSGGLNRALVFSLDKNVPYKVSFEYENFDFYTCKDLLVISGKELFGRNTRYLWIIGPDKNGTFRHDCLVKIPKYKRDLNSVIKVAQTCKCIDELEEYVLTEYRDVQERRTQCLSLD